MLGRTANQTKGRQVGTLVAFLFVLITAMTLFIRSRPMVSDGELADILEEVEVIRESMNHVECHRPALFGPATNRALPLAELLR